MGGEAAHDGGRPARILIVEDDFLLALEMEMTLMDAGFEVEGHAVNMRTVLNVIGAATPDLALVDIGLADGANGVDIAQALSRLGIVSLYVTAQDIAAEQAPLALGILRKPVDPDDLIMSVKAALALRAGETPERVPARLRLFHAAPEA